MERLFTVIGSPGFAHDPEDMHAIATASYERDHDVAGPGRQLAAIIAAGDRTAELQRHHRPDARHPRQRRPAGRAIRRARDRARDTAEPS